MVLNDAAYLDIGQGKCLGQVFLRFGFDHRRVEGLSIKNRNTPVRMDGPAADIADSRYVFGIGNLHIGVLPPFLRQNLDSHVVELRVCGAASFFPVHLAI